MTKKLWFLFATLFALGVMYVVYFSDLFRSPTIQIMTISRPIPAGRAANPRLQTVYEKAAPVIFSFNPSLKLTLVKVVPVPELETNKFPQAVWHLASDSNSAPVKVLIYGIAPAGMRPANKGLVPQPLVPGIVYRLFIEAGDLKGQHDFKAIPKPAKP